MVISTQHGALGIFLETMLVQTVFQPLGKELPAFGEFGVTMLAQTIAQADRSGFADALNRAANSR